MLLTRVEQDFFIVLQQAIPTGWQLFPQVRLANLVDVAPHARRSYTHFNRIAAKCVDFVLCDGATLTPRLVIELDDASHQRPDRQQRDAFVDAVLQAARLPILHVRW
jgi:very-short-patch-repair endonuclease